MGTDHDAETARGVEQRALLFAAIGSLFMAVLGIAFFFWTRAEAVLLDGVFSFVSFFATLAARRVARLVDLPRSRMFHFGYAHFEPLTNLMRGLLILGLCTFALIGAMEALFHGGREISAGPAVIYAAAASLLGGAGGLYLRSAARRCGSSLVALDAQAWFLDGFLSLGAGLIFLFAHLIEGTGWARLAPYVDPALVALMVLLVLRVPLAAIRDSAREVLQVAPEPAVQQQVRERVRDAVAELPLRDLEIGMMKVGRYFYVLTHALLPADHRVERVGDLDDVRCRVADALREVPERLVADTLFTADERWVTSTDVRDCAE
jgi:predicted Co/Zn/Cd cation transporter (cation efflux family)